jgi:hypothetical protein
MLTFFDSSLFRSFGLLCLRFLAEFDVLGAVGGHESGSLSGGSSRHPSFHGE